MFALDPFSNSACRVPRDKPRFVSRSSASPSPPTGSPVGLSEREALAGLLRRQDLRTLRPQRLADQGVGKLRVTGSGRGTHLGVIAWEAIIGLLFRRGAPLSSFEYDSGLALLQTVAFPASHGL